MIEPGDLVVALPRLTPILGKQEISTVDAHGQVRVLKIDAAGAGDRIRKVANERGGLQLPRSAAIEAARRRQDRGLVVVA